jgi:hypothetical protein
MGHAHQSGSPDGKGDLPTAAGDSTPGTGDAHRDTDQTPQGRHERPRFEADSDTEVTELLGLPIGNSRDSIPLYTLEVQDESGESYEPVTLSQSLDEPSNETPQALDMSFDPSRRDRAARDSTRRAHVRLTETDLQTVYGATPH